MCFGLAIAGLGSAGGNGAAAIGQRPGGEFRHRIRIRVLRRLDGFTVGRIDVFEIQPAAAAPDRKRERIEQFAKAVADTLRFRGFDRRRRVVANPQNG